jgi:hypothetical protein
MESPEGDSGSLQDHAVVFISEWPVPCRPIYNSACSHPLWGRHAGTRQRSRPCSSPALYRGECAANHRCPLNAALLRPRASMRFNPCVSCPEHGLHVFDIPTVASSTASACAGACKDLRHAHVDDSVAHACCVRYGDRHCTVTVAYTTAGGPCNSRVTQVAPPHPPWMGAGQGNVMAARPLFTERGKFQMLAAVCPRHGRPERARRALLGTLG